VLYRYTVLVAVCALILIASGAVITSGLEPTPAQAAFGALTQAHLAIAIAVGVLVLALGVWLWTTKRGSLRVLAAVAVALAAADSLAAIRRPLPPELAVLHAWLAPVFFTALVAVALFTSPHWSEEPELVDDRGFPFLRPLAIATPPLVLMQIVLGAMYRHKLTSVFWHMGGAMLVSLATLVASMVVMQQYPAHRALRGSAVALMSIVLGQVALGVAAFTMELLEMENAVVLAVVTVSHVVVGNLTLGASLNFAVQAQRCLRTQS